MIGDRFRMERQLGRGGMASVYLAHDEELGRPVALKVHEGLAGDDDGRRRFLREARLAARLAHPNVVTVYDAGEHEGRPYIVMEYVGGSSLAELIALRGRLPAEEVAELGRQACAGLQHAHESGLIHRDIKPQNLLVGGDGTLKVSDFGIAVAAEATRITTDGMILGTVAYLAPEQLDGREIGPPADVYALGATLYEALTGRAPMQVESLAELAAAREKPPEPIRRHAPDVPPELERAVMWALEADPADRPGSPSELAKALTLDGADAPTVPLARPRKQRPSRRLAAAAAAFVLAAAATAIGLAASQPDGDPAPLQPVPQRAEPAQQARALADWLRENSAG